MKALYLSEGDQRLDTSEYSGCGDGIDLMVSALDSGSGGPGSSSGRGTAVCSWAPRCINGYRRIYCWG